MWFAAASINVACQPLQLTYRPAALDQLSRFTAADMPKDTQGSRVLGAVNGIECAAARTLAKARMVWDPSQTAGSFILQVTVCPMPS